MTRAALVIGATAAGLQAALDLADSGIRVHLVEPSPFLGSDGSAKVLPHLFNTRLLEVARHPNVTAWTNTRLYRVEGEAGSWTVELRQHPRHIDLTRCTACGDCVQVCPVTVPGTDHKAIYLTHGGQPGCAAIDKLGKPPCSNTCPGGIHVQGYVALTAEGRFQEALDLIREAIPFPGICGRICTHPCEVNCRRAEVDKPVAIRSLKRFLADWELEERGSGRAGPERHPQSPVAGYQAAHDGSRSESADRVAVVGAGPGGMATAGLLAQMGYLVTVFERLPVIGGMMAVGIPEYRLPRDVVAREYQRIEELGVEVRLNTAIGLNGDYSLDDLFASGYRAVCLAIGAHRSHELRIPGEDLLGVVQGVELLKVISFSQQLGGDLHSAELQRLLRRGATTRAAVLGGGNTAMDVSRSLRRFGLADVRILYRRTRAEMPAMPEEVEDAEREGVAIEFLVSPIRVIGDAESGVTGLECLRMKLGEPDASGRRRPVPIAGSEFLVDLDLVVLAIGQAPDLEALGPESGIAITRDERINVDALTFMTSRPGMFACGDAVTADRMAIIEAIGLGKKAAAGIDAYLHGLQPQKQVTDARQVPIARREMAPDELGTKPRVPVPTLPMEQRLSSYREVELGYSAEQAILEAHRCLVCGPCSECLACVRACKPGAVVHEQHETLATLDIGAILQAGSSTVLEDWPDLAEAGVICATSDDPLAGSAAAARAMFDLFAERQPWGSARSLSALTAAPRIGVFICECGGYISEVVDTEAICKRAALWPGTVHAQTLPFSCSAEAAHIISQAVEQHSLNCVALAACSCCALDQVCFSCTFQRVRCKDNLGVFAPLAPDGGNAALHGIRFEFVNIREQCAWAHTDDPPAATAKATALTAGAVARLRSMPVIPVEIKHVERSALVLGSGAAGRSAVQALTRQGIAARLVRGSPQQVLRTSGLYRVVREGSLWEAAALVLAPTPAEAEPMMAAFGGNGQRPRSRPEDLPDTHRPGIYLCDSAMDAARAGDAAAARVAAWLARVDGRARTPTAVVDPARCRACGTCASICEFGAPGLLGEEPHRTSWIDPAICTGCGACAARCPSSAIAAGHFTDAQLEAALEALAGNAA